MRINIPDKYALSFFTLLIIGMDKLKELGIDTVEWTEEELEKYEITNMKQCIKWIDNLNVDNLF